MKILVYSIQNSGATFFTFLLSQDHNTLAILDLWNKEVAPLFVGDVIVKATVNMKIDLSDHVGSFQPDRVILFLRNPVDIYLKLSAKRYANMGGTPLEKLRKLNSVYLSKNYDLCLKYEDLCSVDYLKHRLKEIDVDLPNRSRSLEDIKKYNFERSVWCRDNFNIKWGLGNIHQEEYINCKSEKSSLDELKSLEIFKIYYSKIL